MCTIATTYYWLTLFARMRQGRLIEKQVGKMCQLCMKRYHGQNEYVEKI